ncbi:MAG: YdcF family protein [Halobacteria archaeon]|nr:YdcF family protein [Halobacteria archaeon]
MEVLLIKIIQTLLLPPGLMILLMLGGYLLAKRMPRTGKSLFISGFALLVLSSLPIVAEFNTRLLYTKPVLPRSEIQNPTADAIVILGGGRIHHSPEYGHDIPADAVLQRLRYGALLHRQTGVPILVSGGNVYSVTKTSEAVLMRDVLQNDMHTPVRWLEDQSRTTWENASYSKTMLAQNDIKRIYLVTQGFHMARSVIAFEAAGFEVLPAPTGFATGKSETPLLIRLLPASSAIKKNSEFMHEVLGILWYKLRY